MTKLTNITKYVSLLIVTLTLLIPTTAYSLECTLKNGACVGAEECIISLSDTTGAHAEECTELNYAHNLCCSDTVYTLSTTYSDGCATAEGIISLFAQTGSHVEEYPSINYANDVCLTATPSGIVTCTYTDNACNPGYTCLLSMSDSTNAHLANCTGVGSYTKKICCMAISSSAKGNITGTVTNTSADSLENVIITATSAAGDIFTNTTNALGEYTITGANISTYTITSSLTNYDTATATGADVNTTETAIIDFILAIATEKGNITGTVINLTGNPLAGATVTAISATSTVFTNTTNALGEYTLDGLDISTYTVTASVSSYNPGTFIGIDVNITLPAIINIMLSPIIATYTSTDAIVHFETKEDITIQLGRRDIITIYIKNPTDDYIIVPLHIGSPDTTFRNFVDFKNSNIDNHNYNITLAPRQEKLIPIRIFAGKLGNYELVVGPDNIYENRYDTKRIVVVNNRAGIFAQSPGITWSALILAILLAAALLLARNIKPQKQKK